MVLEEGVVVSPSSSGEGEVSSRAARHWIHHGFPVVALL